MIVIEGVRHRRGGTLVLDGITATVPRGGVTALVGANGAGKSTLLALMARLLPLQQGTITVDGRDIARTPSRDIARRLAILRQDAAVATRLTVRDLVGFGRYPHHLGRSSREDDRLREEALARFDLLPLGERFLDTLSGGQRQRAFIAMAYCQGTDYLLLDEPLDSLDMGHARFIMRTLRSLAHDDGRTVIVVVHDINHAAAHADRILALKDGRIAAHGTVAEVMREDVLEEIFGYRFPIIESEGLSLALHHR